MIFLRMNAFLALAASSSTVAAFQPNVSRFNSNSPPLHLNLNLHLHHSAHQRTRSAKAMTFTSALRMSKRSEDDDDEDDDYIDDADLGDWRSFRKTLVDSNFSDEQSDQTTDGFIGEGVDNSDIGDISDIKSSSQDTPAKEKRPKSVSKANEELLKTQSESLAKEYVNGIWAHVSSFVSSLTYHSELWNCFSSGIKLRLEISCVHIRFHNTMQYNTNAIQYNTPSLKLLTTLPTSLSRIISTG